MKYRLIAEFPLSGNALSIKKDIYKFFTNYNNDILDKYDQQNRGTIEWKFISEDKLELKMISGGNNRAHNHLPRIKKAWINEIGKKNHISGGKRTKIKKYEIEFELDKKPLKDFSIPFADLKIKGKNVKMILKNVDDEFLKRNYIDRMITLVKEKVENQYYEGKGEFWKPIWESPQKKPVWEKDPTEEMVKLNWLQQGPTKGKWFYRPQITAIMKAMEEIAIKEVLQPLGFQEIIESHIVPFDVWLKTGHMEGMPGEFYYICEPSTRDVERWERFVDLTKITKEIPIDELQKNLSAPSAGICYAQCPIIYWSFKGKTIAEKSLPILVYENTAISGRYESGGRHGIERVDEFHRIEPVYIGTKKQLIDLREKMLDRYKHVFNNILDLEWRMAWVTPWYMQQAGKTGAISDQETGTIDFESYMPYRGDRKKSEWLEFQNFSILGDKYIKSFNIKAQKSNLWSGCSGIGLERWTTAFLAQKGLDPGHWPTGFRKYLKELPKGIEFL